MLSIIHGGHRHAHGGDGRCGGDRGLVHLKDQGTLLHEGLRAEEGSGVVGESIVVAGLPSGQIQEVEVISPVQLEAPRLFIVSVDLNVVVHGVPGHV